MTELVFSSQVSKRFTRQGGRRVEGQTERWRRKLIPSHTLTRTRFLFRERNCVTDAKDAPEKERASASVIRGATLS